MKKYLLFVFIYSIITIAFGRNYKLYMRSWRNWQTRTVQVRVGDHGGSNPLDRTKSKRHPYGCLFCYHTITEEIRTREGMSVIRMSCEHSNNEWSEGDREGSRGGSLQAKRGRRSDPLDRTS